MLAKLQGTSCKTLLSQFGIEAPDIVLTDLVLDSREVAIHKGFVAIKGHQLDGRDFIPQAISLGAKVIITECDDADTHGRIDMREQSLIIQFYQLRERLSEITSAFYGAPDAALDIVAVTGTNGKTSTVQLITQLRHYLGHSSASIGTLGAGLYAPEADNELETTINTTPDATQMYRLLNRFQHSGAKQVALEASSHALVQGRISSLQTKVAVFTNLTRDHLDYHGTMEEYAKAKRLLVQQPGLEHLVINMDDRESANWIKVTPQHINIIVFATENAEAAKASGHKYCVATNIRYLNDGVHFEIQSSYGNADISVPLLGQFNVSNILAAICTQLALGASLAGIAEICHKLRPVAGRMEVFVNPDGANVAVDYAHTPDALKQALVAARRHCEGQLWCIFGCGGDRDQGKRPLMGEIAEQHSDKIIITSDNTRSEDPQAIVKDILAGCVSPGAIQTVLDRKAAIQSAIDQAADNDLVLVAGKGHENYQIIGEQTLPYNERYYVKQLFKGNGQ